MKKKYRTIQLKLGYYPSMRGETSNLFFGGVDTPKYEEELKVWVTEEQDFDLEKNAMVRTGKFQVNIGGSSRALAQFGKFLINISKFKSHDTQYHEHLTEFSTDPNGPPIEIIVHGVSKED